MEEIVGAFVALLVFLIILPIIFFTVLLGLAAAGVGIALALIGVALKLFFWALPFLFVCWLVWLVFKPRADSRSLAPRQ